MNILYIISKAGPRVRGFTKYIRKQGHRVILLDTHKCWFPLQSIDSRVSEEISGVLKIINPPFLLKNIKTRALISLANITEFIIDEALSNNIDVIISYNPHINTALPSLIASNILRIPWVLDYADLVAIYDTYDYIRSALEIFFCKKAHGVIVLTKAWKRVLEKCWGIPKYKISVLPNGVDLEIFCINKMRTLNSEIIKSKLGIDSNDNVVCYTGSISYRKLKRGLVDLQNVRSLIEAIPYVVRKHSNVKFLLCGFKIDRKLYKLIEYLNLQDFIRITGPYVFGSDEHLGYLKIADVFWMGATRSYAMEYFDRFKIYEYMAVGKPVIAPATISMREILGDTYPFLVKYEDSSEIAKCIIQAIEDKSLREELSKKLRKKIEMKYNWKYLASKLLSFLSKIT